MAQAVWTWRNNCLYDPAGTQVAYLLSGVIHTAEHQLLAVVHRTNMSFTISATASTGEVFSLEQESFTIARLIANCGGRRYLLNRTKWLKRNRELLDADGAVVALTCPQGSTVEIETGPAIDTVPELDFVFLAWAVMEADNSGRLCT